MTSRRGFLGVLGAALAGAVLDPERALWVPGARTISIPAARAIKAIADEYVGAFFTVGDLVTIGGLPYEFVVTALGEAGGVLGAQLRLSDKSIEFERIKRRGWQRIDAEFSALRAAS